MRRADTEWRGLARSAARPAREQHTDDKAGEDVADESSGANHGNHVDELHFHGLGHAAGVAVAACRLKEGRGGERRSRARRGRADAGGTRLWEGEGTPPRALRGLGAGASPNASLARVRMPFCGWLR